MYKRQVPPLTPPVTEELYSFKLTLTDGDSAAGVAFRAESGNLWHRRVGHINGTWTFFGVCRATVSSLWANCSRATSAPSGKALRRLTRNTRKTTSRSPSSLSHMSRALRGFKFVSKQNHRPIHKMVGGFPPQGKMRRRQLSSALQPARRHPVRVPSGARQR